MTTVHDERAMVTAESRDADGWFTSGRFAAMLAALLFVVFPGVILGRVTFFQRDFGVFTYPVAHYFRECFWRGELPLWNPLNNCGIPLLAQWNTSMLYPPSLFYLTLPLEWSLGVFNVAHLFFAGMGMYFLARRWTGNALAASVAGVVFAFNGLSWHMLIWISNLAAWAWMPWVTLTVEQAWLKGGGKRIALAALAGAMQMLTGAPEIIFLTWVFLGAMWLAQLCQGNIPRGRLAGNFFAIAALVTGLCAAQLLPFLQLLAHSHRDANFNGGEWSMPLFGPGNFVLPLFHCYSGPYGVYVQHDQYWTSSYYLGAGAIGLAAAAVWAVRDRRVWLLAAAAIVCLLLALGKNGFLYPAAKAALPLLGVMRYPIKFVAMVVFCVPLLAAYAVAWCQSKDRADAAATSARVLGGAAILLLAALGVALWMAWKFPMERDNWELTWQNAATRALYILLVPAVLLLSRKAASFNLQVLLRVGLVALLWMDVYTHAPNLNPTLEQGIYAPGLIRKQLNAATQPRMGEPRFMETIAAMDRIRYTALSNPTDDYLCRRLALYDNCNLLDDLPKLDGFFSLYLRESDEALSLLFAADAHGVDLKGLKDFLGVQRISAPDTAPEKVLDWNERDSFLPLVTAGAKPVFADERETLKALSQTNFDPRETVYLPPEAKEAVKAAAQQNVKITAKQFAAQELSMDVDTGGKSPVLLTVAQSYYPAWRAYVDGKPARLWRVDSAFQSVEVPQGKHAVRLVYEDTKFRAGAIISILALAATAGLWFFGKKRVET